MSYLHFQSVRWKNIFSYGDSWTTVQLDRSPSTLIIGKNGHGKSVLFEAIHICLFNAAIRDLPKKQMIVSDKNNKGALIEVKFMRGEDQFLVRRGIKPDVFEVEENGVPWDKDAAAKDTQNRLLRDVLKGDKIGFQITTQISKSSEYKNFMSLNAADRRKFVDNMLESFIFTDMAKLHKGKYDILKTELEQSTLRLARQEATVTGKKAEIETAEEMVKGAKATHLANLQSKIDSHRERIEQNGRKVTTLNEKMARIEENGNRLVDTLRVVEGRLADFKAAEIADPVPEVCTLEEPVKPWDEEARQNRAGNVKKANDMLLDVKSKINAQKAGIESLDAGYCNACRQEVSEEHVAAEREKVEAKIAELTSVMEKLVAKRDAWVTEHEQEGEAIEAYREAVRAVQAEKDAVDARNAEALRDVKRQRQEQEREVARRQEDVNAARRDIEKNGREIDEVNGDIAVVEGETRRLEKDIKSIEIEKTLPFANPAADKVKSLKAEFKTLSDELESISSSHDEKGKLAEHYKLLTEMLRDSGFKTVIVKKYLPIINRVVNEKMAELGFHVKFDMDENFKERLLFNGVTERVYSQFSEGQKLRIDIAMILAWREISRLQGRMSSNLLMFDETLDASLDDEGYENLTEIFNRLENLNMFVISHNGQKMENFVRTKMRFEYKDGFSGLAETIDT